jgi:amidohydrolase
MADPEGSLTERAGELLPRLVAWRRHLHAHPDLSTHEEETAAYLQRELLMMGLDPWRPLPNAVVAEVGPAGGPLVALRADIDALPVHEETGLPFASVRPGVMHACGHDGHTAVLLGVAALLRTHPQFPGRVRLIFQPAEEVTPGGAELLVSAGVLDGVGAIAGLHLWAPLPSGQAVVAPGPAWASVDRFRAVFVGRAGHAALPHRAVDALEVACRGVGALQTVASRRVDPLAPVVVTVGTFHAGQAFNIIAGRAELEGTVRAFDAAVRAQVAEQVESVLRHTAEAGGAELEFEYIRGCPPVVNDPEVASVVARAAAGVLGPTAVHDGPPHMAGDDFGHYLERVPGCYLLLGSGGADGSPYPHHHPRFDIDEATLPQGVAILAATAWRLLERARDGGQVTP